MGSQEVAFNDACQGTKFIFCYSKLVTFLKHTLKKTFLGEINALEEEAANMFIYLSSKSLCDLVLYQPL